MHSGNVFIIRRFCYIKDTAGMQNTKQVKKKIFRKRGNKKHKNMHEKMNGFE